MRRTLLSTTTTTTTTIIVILIAVSWLSETPVRGFPTGTRRTFEPSSARRRDDLIAGSDFLDMFIGASVAPSARSRRFPTSRSSAELRNRFHRERVYPSGVMTQYRNYPSDSHSVAEKSDKVTGYVSALDRQSVQKKLNRVPSQGEPSLEKTLQDHRQQENSAEQEVQDVEGAGFGSRTIPRPPRVALSASPADREAAAPNGEISQAYRQQVSEDIATIPVSVISPEGETSQGQSSSAYQVMPNENSVPVRASNNLVSPRFSVSSSVQKITYKTEQKNIRDRTVHNTQRPLTTSTLFSSTSIEPVDSEDFERQDASTQDFPSTGSSLSTTDSNTFSTVDDVSTITSTPNAESTTESIDDWSTKSDAFTTAGADDKLPSESTEATFEEDLAEEVPRQVVSVRVSSSVGHSSLTSQSQEQQPTEKPFSSGESHSSALPDYEDASEAEEASLVTEEQPLAKFVQRSELSVEESLPSELTAGSQEAHSRLHAPRANHYQNSPEETTADSDSSASSYQPTSTTNAGRSRLFGFGKPPGYRRSFASVRRAAADASVVDASVVETSQRRFSPRFAAERSSSRTQNKEPVSVAESIQRSVIANQDVDGTDSRRGQYQDKTGYGAQLKNEEEDDDDSGYGDNDRARKNFQAEPIEKSYSQPERIYGRPEKVYGEPEKVYGEPEKVYGEPAKVYGEPSKVYSEPAKVYSEPAKVYSEPAKVYSEPAKIYSEPAKVYSEPAKVYGEPSKVYGEPSKVYGEPSKNYAVPEENYEVDESVSVQTNGRAHGVQPQTPAPSQVDNDMKVFDTRQQDPNHKFGYVVEGRDYRKYRVEERTSDGFIVGEYGVVSNDGGNLRGVRYTADGTINPRLIYDTLLKFLSL